jgi:hypothetical protein
MNIKEYYFTIGRGLADADNINVAAVVKRSGFTAYGVLFGFIENQGTGNFDLSIASSSDNGVDDAYSAVTFRVGGSGVTSLTVKAGGSAEFVIEYAAAFRTDDYLKFTVAASSGVTVLPIGLLGLVCWHGSLEQRNRVLTV